MPDNPTVAIGPGVWVTLCYHLYDEDDEIVESSDEAGCLEALYGYGQLSPTLERGLDGAVVGETRTVMLKGADAFGERDQEKILEVDRAEFPEDVEPGDEFEAEGADGHTVSLRVLEVTDEIAVIDTNHPLAGQEVRIEVTVEDARPATGAEIAKAEELMMAEPPSSPVVAPGRLVRGK